MSKELAIRKKVIYDMEPQKPKHEITMQHKEETWKILDVQVDENNMLHWIGRKRMINKQFMQSAIINWENTKLSKH